MSAAPSPKPQHAARSPKTRRAWAAAWAAWALIGAGAALAQEPPKESRTAQARYIAVAQDLACEGLRFGAVGQEGERKKAHEAALARHGFTRASFLEASFRYGAHEDVARAVEQGARLCDVKPPAGLVSGVYTQEFQHEAKIQGWFSLSVLQNGYVGGLVSGSADGAPLSFRVGPQHLQGEKLAFSFTTPEGLTVAFEGKLGRGTLQGQLSFLKPPQEARRVGIYSSARR
jgi:hypothetical protein